MHLIPFECIRVELSSKVINPGFESVGIIQINTRIKTFKMNFEFVSVGDQSDNFQNRFEGETSGDPLSTGVLVSTLHASIEHSENVPEPVLVVEIKSKEKLDSISQ